MMCCSVRVRASATSCSGAVRAFAVALIAAFASANGAFATTTDYAWSQTATSFGDYVTVTHDDEGNVSSIAATASPSF